MKRKPQLSAKAYVEILDFLIPYAEKYDFGSLRSEVIKLLATLKPEG